MSRRKKNWRDLTAKQRCMVVGLAVVQLTLNALVQRDLTRRTAADLRGGKGFWRLAAFVHPIGPVAYFLVGRRRSAAAS